MTTTSAGARASRRAAARQAVQQPPVQTTETPEVLTDVMGDDVDAAAEEAFGPSDLGAQAPQSAANPSPRSTTQAPQAGSPVRAATGGGAIALPMEDLTRKIDVGDLIIPKLRISQAMSGANTLYTTSRGKDGVQMGNWYISSQGKDLGQTIYFVVTDMRKSRAMFVQGQGLMCRSFDLVQGEGDPGILCEGTFEEKLTVPAEHRGCPLRLWNDKTPPKCGMTYNYPGLVITDIEKPTEVTQAILQLRSAATQAAKAINTIVMNEGGGTWQNVILELSIDTKTNTKGTFFVPVVDFFDTTDAPEFARLKRRADAMARSVGATQIRTSLEDDGE